MALRKKVAEAIWQVEEKLYHDDFLETEEIDQLANLKQFRETLLRCYNFGCEVR